MEAKEKHGLCNLFFSLHPSCETPSSFPTLGNNTQKTCRQDPAKREQQELLTYARSESEHQRLARHSGSKFETKQERGGILSPEGLDLFRSRPTAASRPAKTIAQAASAGPQDGDGQLGARPEQLSASFLDGITHFLGRKNHFRTHFSEFIRGYSPLAGRGFLGPHGVSSGTVGLLSCVQAFAQEE